MNISRRSFLKTLLALPAAYAVAKIPGVEADPLLLNASVPAASSSVAPLPMPRPLSRAGSITLEFPECSVICSTVSSSATPASAALHNTGYYSPIIPMPTRNELNVEIVGLILADGTDNLYYLNDWTHSFGNMSCHTRDALIKFYDPITATVQTLGKLFGVIPLSTTYSIDDSGAVANSHFVYSHIEILNDIKGF